MTDTTQLKWLKAIETGEPVKLGDTVICDVCNEDYTQSGAIGGFIFGSYAYCPSCARSYLPKIEGYGEQDHIKAWCDDETTFADFVRGYRGPDAYIQVRAGPVTP